MSEGAAAAAAAAGWWYTLPAEHGLSLVCRQLS